MVTDSAKRKWVRFVKKELENVSGAQKIYISGCGAFKDGKAQNDFFEIYPELAHARKQIEVLDEAPIEDNKKNSLREKEKQEMHQEHVKKKSTWIDLSKLKAAQKTQIYTKKFILIQGGCDSFCTFCLTVQKRGRHYYRAAEDIIEEIKTFEAEGGKEVVLTGVNLSAWGLDNTHSTENFSQDIIKNGISGEGSRFAELLWNILENTSIPRIRISSLGPEFVDDAVLEVLAEERIYPHFHFSIQSGSNNVLKSMARHYDGDYMRRLLEKTRNIKRKDGVSIGIWADLIVGFPGETQEDFMDTYNLVKDYNITKVHAFPFSAHTMGESVPAGKFKNQVADTVKKDRMQKLMDIADTARNDFKASQKWKVLKVLVEKISWNSWSWWTENYLEADETNFEITIGNIKKNSIIVGKFI